MTDHQSMHLVRYVGRLGADTTAGRAFGTVDASTAALTFDDLTPPATLNKLLESATVAFIEDPLSFPWDVVNLDNGPLMIVDTSRCSEADVTALIPALMFLTSVDTVLDPVDAATRSISDQLGTRVVPPTPGEWAGLAEQRRILIDERALLLRIKREVGEGAIIRRIEIGDFAATPGGFGAHLRHLARVSNARPVGIWGVRSSPGAPLHHGLAVLTPNTDS